MSTQNQGHPTIDEFVRRYHEGFPDYVPPNGNHRLWVHDLLHALLQTSTQSAIGEEITSIYQAVLLRDDRVDLRQKEHKDYGRDVTLDAIKQNVIPGVHAFVAYLGRRYGFESKHHLDDEQIEAHFERAQKLHYLMVQAFGGRQLGEVPIDELKTQPVAVYKKLIDHLDRAPRGGPGSRSQAVFALAM